MRFARPNPCCGPMVWRVRKIIRSRVPCKMSDLASPVGIQEKFDALTCRMSTGRGRGYSDVHLCRTTQPDTLRDMKLLAALIGFACALTAADKNRHVIVVSLD